ncbi:MAG: hypothetical protein LBU02_02840 [Rickettsiales bacterium]|nr:hypothetical protein [Rickettsiales bacterium]
MKVTKAIVNNTKQVSEGNKKHLVYFFGLGESIKYNNEDNDWGKWISNKNIDIHLFDYHYANFLYPEHFHDTKFWLKRVLITAATALAIGFAGYFIITSQMSTWLKLPVFIVFLVPAIIAAAIVTFYPITTSAIKFATEGRDPIKAGMAIVTDLLEKGVHPDDIILMGNSLGGGVAAEVLKKFEEENIFFTLIHSNSYDSWINVPKSQKSFIGKVCERTSIVDKWFKRFSFDYKPNEIIKSTRAPVLATNRWNDMVIDSAAQSVPNLRKSEGNHESAGKDGFKVTAFLLHRFGDGKCETIKDGIHIDKLTHMFVDDMSYLESQERGLRSKPPCTYEELLEDFIDEARKYLKENKLNNGFKLGTFQDSKLYQEIKKNEVSFVNVDSPNSSLTVNDEPSGSVAGSHNHSPTLSSCL